MNMISQHHSTQINEDTDLASLAIPTAAATGGAEAEVPVWLMVHLSLPTSVVAWMLKKV